MRGRQGTQTCLAVAAITTVLRSTTVTSLSLVQDCGLYNQQCSMIGELRETAGYCGGSWHSGYGGYIHTCMGSSPSAAIFLFSPLFIGWLSCTLFHQHTCPI